MKICMIVEAFPPKWLAGTEIATLNISRGLNNKGHQVHVITIRDDHLPKYGIEDGIHVHRVVKRRNIPVIISLLFVINSLITIKKIDPDIIEYNLLSRQSMLLIASKILFKKPYVVYCRGADVDFNWLFKRQVLTLLFRYSDASIALTQYMKNQMQKIYPREVYTIPNGIYLDKFPRYDKEKARASIGLKSMDKIVVFVGRLHQQKGLEYLIRAAKILKDKKIDIKILLVGYGAEEEKLRVLGKELELNNIIITGKVPNDKINVYLAASDIFVFQSVDGEGFPNVLLEAMAMGLPVITTNILGLPEIINNGTNGYVVEPHNPDQIADKILALLNDSQLAENISKYNQVYIKNYRWENSIDQLEVIYSKIISKEGKK